MPGGSNVAGTLISLHHWSELPVFRRTNPAWRSLGVDEAPADAGSARIGSRLVEIRPVSGGPTNLLPGHAAMVAHGTSRWDGRTLQLPQDGPIRSADCLPEVRARNACRRDRFLTAASERTGVRECVGSAWTGYATARIGWRIHGFLRPRQCEGKFHTLPAPREPTSHDHQLSCHPFRRLPRR